MLAPPTPAARPPGTSPFLRLAVDLRLHFLPERLWSHSPVISYDDWSVLNVSWWRFACRGVCSIRALCTFSSLTCFSCEKFHRGRSIAANHKIQAKICDGCFLAAVVPRPRLFHFANPLLSPSSRLLRWPPLSRFRGQGGGDCQTR
jgi:hypothetical protein